MNIYFNRLTIVFYIGALVMSSILFTNNPYLNVLIMIIGACIIMGGCSYIIENKELNEHEQKLIKKLEKFFS